MTTAPPPSRSNAGGMRLRDLADGARRRLEAAGIPSAEAALDAELFARHALGWDRATWLAHRDDDADAEDRHTSRSPDSRPFAPAFEALVRRRLRREPMAYILGVQEFYGREFRVGPGVLIPRPETELLVDTVRAVAAGRTSPRLADIGTGSGCIAVTLALEMASAHVVATDLSSEALAIAHANAAAHGVAERVAFVRTSCLDGVAGRFDVVASNPPYVRDVDAERLPPEVREHEPPSALFAGPDGLREIAAIVAAAPSTLAPGGALVLEIGVGQVDGVLARVAAAGLVGADVRHDLQGIPRVVVASLP
jgi:release factor glutamine methyltransferase